MMDNTPFDGNALKILEKRYLRRDENNEIIETPREMFERVADAVASVEGESRKDEWKKSFFDMMWNKQFLPNSPTLVNAGTDKGSLSACFVMSPEDTMESIMQVARDAAMVEKWGGGIGFNLSKLRPKNDRISTTHGKALGPIGVMRIYAKIGTEITQGSFRLGAHMAMLDVSHPDIYEFIHCKDDVRENNELSNFNISVRVSDRFMEAVQQERKWDLINPRNGEVVESILAVDLWNELCESAWKTGDPGLGFMDRVMEHHPNPHLGELTSNPCGEQFLENYNSCNLGSINLYAHLTGNHNGIDYNMLEKTVCKAVRFLDNVVSINKFPVQSISHMNKKTRRIGLGVMGWADVLMAMDIPYDSPTAISFAGNLARFIRQIAWKESAHLAEIKGPFAEFERSQLKMRGSVPVRNSCVTNTAPTGTISRIAGCSSGIEPHFALAYKSNVLWEDQEGTTTTLYDVPAPVRNYLEGYMVFEDVEGFLEAYMQGDELKLKTYIGKSGMDRAMIESTALKIRPRNHVEMQVAWQLNGNTNATSKTVNLPESATVNTVKNVYESAWQYGCKGITVYRQGSRDKEVLITEKEKPNVETKVEVKGKMTEQMDIVQERWCRPETLASTTTRWNTGHGGLYITVGKADNKLREVFLSMGKAGGCESANMETIARLVSMALQYDIPPSAIIQQLSGITCCPIWVNGQQVKSPVDALAILLNSQPKDDNVLVASSEANELWRIDTSMPLLCTQCGDNMIMESGCPICTGCGYSKCG